LICFLTDSIYNFPVIFSTQLNFEKPKIMCLSYPFADDICCVYPYGFTGNEFFSGKTEIRMQGDVEQFTDKVVQGDIYGCFYRRISRGNMVYIIQYFFRIKGVFKKGKVYTGQKISCGSDVFAVQGRHGSFTETVHTFETEAYQDNRGTCPGTSCDPEAMFF